MGRGASGPVPRARRGSRWRRGPRGRSAGSAAQCAASAPAVYHTHALRHLSSNSWVCLECRVDSSHFPRQSRQKTTKPPKNRKKTREVQGKVWRVRTERGEIIAAVTFDRCRWIGGRGVVAPPLPVRAVPLLLPETGLLTAPPPLLSGLHPRELWLPAPDTHTNELRDSHILDISRNISVF